MVGIGPPLDPDPRVASLLRQFCFTRSVIDFGKMSLQGLQMSSIASVASFRQFRLGKGGGREGRIFIPFVITSTYASN